MASEGRACAVDWPALMARLEGDRELLAELVELFEADGRDLVAAVRSGIAAGDAGAVYRAAHTLKGAVGNFCAPAAVTAALALETAGRNGDLSSARALLARLEVEIAAVRAALALTGQDS